MSKRFRFIARQSRHLFVVFAAPLLLLGTGYAIYSQQLSLNGSAAKPAYSSSQNVWMTYVATYGSSGGRVVYNITATIQNKGATAIESWALSFDMPSDFTSFSCASTVSCSTSGARATAINGTSNGTIAAGGSTQFTLTFRSYTANYQLQNIAVSGVQVVVYQTISGLTASRSVGTRTKSGNRYYWPYSFTVTNNSGASVSKWRITANWSSTETVSSMATTVSYMTTTSTITILSKTAVANGQNFVFTSSLSSTNSAWALSGMTIQGAY